MELKQQHNEITEAQSTKVAEEYRARLREAEERSQQEMADLRQTLEDEQAVMRA